MSDKKISQLTAAAPLTGTEIVPLVQSGQTVSATAQDIADLGGGGAAYTTYVAVVTQSGTSAPVEETVFENTLGGPSPVWGRTSPGNFNIQHPSFLVSKTYVIGSFRNPAMTGIVENIFGCSTDGTVSWGGSDATFATANRIYIEIRVYP